MSGTSTYNTEDVRLALVAQIQQNVAWKHARLFYLGVGGQGAQFGDRTFDIKTGKVIPLRAPTPAEYVEATFLVRLRHRAATLASAEGAKIQADDCDWAINALRMPGQKIPSDIQIFWRERAQPVINKDFVDTDLTFAARYYRPLAGQGAL